MLSGLCVLAFAGFIAWQADEMPSSAAGFPRLIAAGFVLFGGILFIRALVSKKETVVLFQGIHWKALLTTLGTWLLVVIFVDKVGFFVLSGLFLAVMAWFLRDQPRDIRSLAEIGAFAIGTVVGLWVIFVVILDREFPSGFLI